MVFWLENPTELNLMQKTLRTYILLSMTVFICGIAGNLSASVGVPIYSNSSNDLFMTFEPGTMEVGDEISFGSPERYLQTFSFEYWGTNTGGGAFAGPSPAGKLKRLRPRP